MSSTYESLPPRVVGELTGNLRIKLHKVEGVAKSPLTVPGTCIRFEWWGQHGGFVYMTAPWKPGMPEEEAVFPLRAGKESLVEYLKDMQTLKIEVLDADKRPIGTTILPVGEIATSNMDFRGSLPVKEARGVNKRQIGEIILSTMFEFKDTTTSSRINTTTTTASVPKGSKSGLPPQPTLADKSPARMEKGTKAAKVAAAKMPEVSSFQRNEALVLTDNSNQYAPWPETPGKATDVAHRLGSATVGFAVEKSGKTGNKMGKTKAAVGSVAVSETIISHENTSRAPLVQKRASVLRSMNKKNATAVENELPQIESEAGLAVAEEEEVVSIEVMPKPPSSEELAMRMLLQQAEGLLQEVQTVRGYVQTDRTALESPVKPMVSSSSSSSSSSSNVHAPVISAGPLGYLPMVFGGTPGAQLLPLPIPPETTRHSSSTGNGVFIGEENPIGSSSSSSASSSSASASSGGGGRSADYVGGSHGRSSHGVFGGLNSGLFNGGSSSGSSSSAGAHYGGYRYGQGSRGGGTGTGTDGGYIRLNSHIDDSSTLTQLDWLLRGLPEAYEDGGYARKSVG